MLKVSGSLQKSTEIMRLSNQLVKLPEVSRSMREMSTELVKAGILEEMLDDTLDSSVLGEDADEIEGEAQAEVDGVLYELTDGAFREARTLTRQASSGRQARRASCRRCPSQARRLRRLRRASRRCRRH